MPALVYLVGTLAMVFTALSYSMPVRGGRWRARYRLHLARPGQGHRLRDGLTLLLDYLLIPVLMYVVASTALSGPRARDPAWAFGPVFVVANTFVNVASASIPTS